MIKVILSMMFLIFVTAPSHAGETKAFGLPPFYDTKDAQSALKDAEYFAKVDLKIEESPIHLVHTGEAASPAVLFIHGSPGSWNAWADYLNDADLRDKAFMIAVDRPAFGGSNDGTSGKSLKEQSRLIMEAVKTMAPKQKSFIIVGHSYGGPLALRIAIDYPKYVQSTILLAPAISPVLTRTKWYNTLADLWLVRALLPTGLHHSNEEMIPLKSELIKMQPRLHEIKIPVTVIQGKKDRLVPAGNADFVKKSLINASVDIHLLEERGHFIPWQEYALVKDVLTQYLTVSE